MLNRRKIGYHFSFNNPINFSDFWGDCPWRDIDDRKCDELTEEEWDAITMMEVEVNGCRDCWDDFMDIAIDLEIGNEWYGGDQSGGSDIRQAGLGGEDLRGPALILLGAPILDKRFVTQATSTSKAASKGTSIASKYLAKLLPYRSPAIKQLTTQIFGKGASTAVLGRALGRAVPYAGWALTAYDVNEYLRETFPAYDDFLNAQSQINQQYGGATYVGSDGIYVCFEAGTLIYTEEGLKSIEELKEGIRVYSYNFETDSLELQPITKFFIREVQEVYEVTVGNEQINVTSEHPFYVKGKEWVKVKDLVPGDQLQSEDGYNVEISSASRTSKTVTVYNIEVAGNHNYYVSPIKILVHNKSIVESPEIEEEPNDLVESEPQRKK